MDPIVSVLLGFIFILFLLNLFLFFRQNKKPSSDTALLEWLKSMQSSIDATNKTLNAAMRDSHANITSTLQEHSRQLNQRLDKAAEVISGVQKNIGEMSEIGRNMQELQEFLASPKLRGNIGEQVLKELLSQLLPKQTFTLQYSFSNGATVDAVIKTESGLIPIDSKFPMENFVRLQKEKEDSGKKAMEKDFNRDVKVHIDSISKKYILTSEGTLDYALMYVPSEAVYYEIVNNPILFEYSSQKRVLIVSPVTFYAYLRAILMGLEGQKVTQKAREILAGIRSVQKNFDDLSSSFETMSRHVTHSYNSMNDVRSNFNKLGNAIITTGKIDQKETKLISKENAIQEELLDES